MAFSSSYENIPWELIASSLLGELPAEDQAELQRWLDLSHENRQLHARLLELCDKGAAGYDLFLQARADTAAGWEDIHRLIGSPAEAPSNPSAAGPASNPSAAGPASSPLAAAPAKTPATPQEPPVPVIPLAAHRWRRWMAAAIFLVLAGGAAWWFGLSRDGAETYTTGANQQKNISLPDGTTVAMEADTRIRVASGYDRSGRDIELITGKALFQVQHETGRPFTVNMGTTSVKDIGTSFSISRTQDSIRVSVLSGKVDFIKNGTMEMRVLAAGMSLTFTAADQQFGEVTQTGQPGRRTAPGGHLLPFDNTLLTDVVDSLEKVFNRKISLGDTAIGHKRMTAQLDGESFENAVRVVCSSLNLYYTTKDSVYILWAAKKAPGP